jgi:hypothetical protein
VREALEAEDITVVTGAVVQQFGGTAQTVQSRWKRPAARMWVMSCSSRQVGIRPQQS